MIQLIQAISLWRVIFLLCPVLDSILSNIDKVLSINRSAVFVFADFNVHDKDCLTYSGGTDRSVDLVEIFLKWPYSDG